MTKLLGKETGLLLVVVNVVLRGVSIVMDTYLPSTLEEEDAMLLSKVLTEIAFSPWDEK